MCAQKEKKPALLTSVLGNKCPRCRRGYLYESRNPYNLKKIVAMPEHCPVCGQKYELEPGFYFGTGYVSYALTVALSVATFVLYYLFIGISIQDNSIFWWLGTNTVILVLLQPVLQRMSRSFWIAFFVRYDANALDVPEEEPAV